MTQRITLLALTLVAGMFIAMPLIAQDEPTAQDSDSVIATELLQSTLEVAPEPTIDPDDLESYLDGLFEAYMATHHIAGTTVSVVHNGQVVLAKGYGFADVEEGRPVSASETLFRPGSISKTFTWTAVMQLVEQGKLDLDADLNDYLVDVVIPDTFPEPITMAHLMTHRPGWEDATLGHLFEDDADEALPLKEYLLTHQPARVRPPGTLPSYSNYGTALAGQVIANISNMPFEDYIDQNILQPLGMNHTTFREPWGAQRPGPMPERLVGLSSTGYSWKNGGFEAGTFEFIGPVGPAGAVSTTATDMARYMLAHLGDGSYNGAQILRPETARQMHSNLYSPGKGMTGNAHGFFEYNVAGHIGYGHSGGTLYFLSDMVMLPEQNFGVFFSSNTDTGGKLIMEVPALLAARYFGDRTEVVPEPTDDFATRYAKVAGTYVGTRRPYTLLEKLVMVPMGTVSISPSSDGYLLVSSGSQTTRWFEVEPLTFQQEGKSRFMTFNEDEAGNITGVPQFMPSSYFVKVGALQNPQLLLGIVGFAAVVFAFALVGFWLRRKRAFPQTAGERLAAWSTFLMSALWVAWAVLATMAFLDMAEKGNAVVFEFPGSTLVTSLTVAIVATVVTAVALLLLWPVWRGGQWPTWRKLRHTVVVILGLATVWVLNDFNVIGYHYFGA